MPFEPINTQEEFEARVTEVYGDIKDLQGKIQTITGERDEANAKLKEYETAAMKRRIAQEKGIPAEFADRLTGETEKDLKADADAMAGMLKAVKGPAPLFDPNTPANDAKTAGMTSMLNELRGE